MTPAHEEARRALRLADHDIVAFKKLKNDPDVHFAITCFHAQQAVEKCMKAVLFERGIVFPPIPLVSSATVEKMGDAMRGWAGEVMK